MVIYMQLIHMSENKHNKLLQFVNWFG